MMIGGTRTQIAGKDAWSRETSDVNEHLLNTSRQPCLASRSMMAMFEHNVDYRSPDRLDA